MNRRTRTRDELDDTPPAPSNNEGEEKKEEGPTPPPQRQRTEPPPSGTEPPPQPTGPTPSTGGGSLSAVLDRNGIQDPSRPPQLRQDNDQVVQGVAVHTFKPRWMEELTPEAVSPFVQNRHIAIQTGIAFCITI